MKTKRVDLSALPIEVLRQTKWLLDRGEVSEARSFLAQLLIPYGEIAHGDNKTPATLFLWKIEQDERFDQGTCGSAVVAAETEEEARKIYPGAGELIDNTHYWEEIAQNIYSSWASSPEHVTATCIGVASDIFKAGEVVCVGFNTR